MDKSAQNLRHARQKPQDALVLDALTAKKQYGKFRGPIAPYGYMKNLQNEIIINEEAAKTVRLIFDLFLSGESIFSILIRLTEIGAETPSQANNRKQSNAVWNEMMIKRILKNQTYIGNSVRICTTAASPLQKRRLLIENTHEPIIRTEAFEDVQKILSGRSHHRQKGQEHLLTGLVFCGDCNSPMTVAKDSRLVCSQWKKHSRQQLCTSHSIKEEVVIHAVLTELYVIAKNIDTDELMFLCSGSSTNKLTASLEKKLFEDRNALLCLYKDKCKGVVSEDDYIFMAENLKKEIVFYSSQLDCFTELQNEKNSCREVSNHLNDILNFEKINKAFLCLLVKRILVFTDKHVVIEFNFTEPK